MHKEPKKSGAWAIHLDFGYYYNSGLLNPD